MIVSSQFELEEGPREPVHITYLKRLREQCQHYPKRIAYANSDDLTNSVTYGDTYRYVRTFASFLHKRGYRKGDVIAILLPNRWEFPIAWIGSWCAGLTTTTPRNSFTKSELVFHLKDCDAKILLTDRSLWKTAKEAIECVQSIKDIITIDQPTELQTSLDFHAIIKEDDFTLDPQSIEINLSEDIIHIQYSSGTTGLPKGVLYRHETYEFSQKIFTFYRKMIQNEVDGEHLNILINLTMQGPWSQQLAISEILHGNTILFQGTPGIEEIFRNIQKHSIHRTHVIPSNVKKILESPVRSQYDLSSLKFLEVGGAIVSPNLVIEGRKKLGGAEVVTAYGSTESGTFVAYFIPGDPPDSIGRLAPGYRMKVKATDSRLCGPCETGELWIHSRGLFNEYLNNPETTKIVFDEDGFFNTGDVGYFDKAGFIYMRGRSREMIVGYESMKVAPAEVEQVLLEVDGVEDVAVVGIPHELYETVPRAFIQSSKEISVDEINKYVKERLAHFKQLRGGIEFVDIVPRNAAGKIMRSHIVDNYLKRSSGKNIDQNDNSIDQLIYNK